MGIIKIVATILGFAITAPQAYIFMHNATILRELNYALKNQDKPNALLRILYRCEKREACLNLIISGSIITVCIVCITLLLTH